MTVRKNGRGLHFPCECVSAQSGYSDAWAPVAQKKMLNDGTKERVLNCVARQPKTIALLANELGLSQPAIHAHVNEMLGNELLRESVEFEKRHPAENYFEPNFPVINAADREAFEKTCRAMALQIADVFAGKRAELERAIPNTMLGNRGWKFADLAHYFYASAYRRAAKLLERRGVLPRRARHGNGIDWIFWAEEADKRVRSKSKRMKRRALP